MYILTYVARCDGTEKRRRTMEASDTYTDCRRATRRDERDGRVLLPSVRSISRRAHRVAALAAARAAAEPTMHQGGQQVAI